MGHGNYTDRQLKEPETNIQLGTWYLGYLLKEFNGDEVQALAAYNAGRGHVESWIKEKIGMAWLIRFHFQKTRYVSLKPFLTLSRKVMSHYMENIIETVSL